MGGKMKKIDKLVEKKKAGELVSLTQDKQAEVRYAAVEALGKVGGEDAYNALIPLVHNADVELRKRAILALGEVGFADARVHIIHQMNKETNEQVQEAIKQALHKLPEDKD